MYFATRSLRLGAPVLIWQVFRATARSAMVVSCCLTGTMRSNSCVTGLVSHLNCFQCLRHRTNLIQLNQDGVSAAHLDTLGQALRIGNEQVVANQLYLVAQTCLGQLLPAFPIFLIQTILDGDNRIFLTEVCPVLDELLPP